MRLALSISELFELSPRCDSDAPAFMLGVAIWGENSRDCESSWHVLPCFLPTRGPEGVGVAPSLSTGGASAIFCRRLDSDRARPCALPLSDAISAALMAAHRCRFGSARGASELIRTVGNPVG